MITLFVKQPDTPTTFSDIVLILVGLAVVWYVLRFIFNAFFDHYFGKD